MSAPLRTLAAGLAVALLGFGMTACGDDAESDSGSPSPTRSADSESSSSSGADEAIEKPLTAVGATKVDYDGATLRAHFDGSVEDATAWLYCSSLEMVAPDADERFLVYDDGELDCAKRPGYGDE